MNKSRLEAFSDGVLAIIITIMVLTITVPKTADWTALFALLPQAVSYLFSFAVVGIYWGNHHHLMQAMRYTTGKIILANLLLLFCLSLLPFATSWMGENNFAPNTIVLYALMFLSCALSWFVLQAQVFCQLRADSSLKLALEKLKIKGWISACCALLAIPFAYYAPLVSGILFVVQAVIWLIPAQKLEKVLHDAQHLNIPEE